MEIQSALKIGSLKSSHMRYGLSYSSILAIGFVLATVEPAWDSKVRQTCHWLISFLDLQTTGLKKYGKKISKKFDAIAFGQSQGSGQSSRIRFHACLISLSLVVLSHGPGNVWLTLYFFTLCCWCCWFRDPRTPHRHTQAHNHLRPSEIKDVMQTLATRTGMNPRPNKAKSLESRREKTFTKIFLQF